jgi:diguanylate cyclase (GGDEF)-like protein
MVMASWPQPSDRRARRPLSRGVRRRVDAALHRGMRQALLIGAPLLVVLLGADGVQSLLRGGPDAQAAAVISLLEMSVVLAGAVAARRGARPEPTAMAILLTIYSATVFEPRFVTIPFDLSLAYMAMLLLASSLFLVWHPRWHVSWLATALALTASGAGAGTLGGADAGLSALIVSGMAAAAGAVGQFLAYARMRRGLEQRFELRELTAVTSRQEAAVTRLNAELVETARVDAVTGLGNRRALDDALAALAGRRLAAVLLDLDHFKDFNDRYGHLAGDAALARVGELLRQTVRADDLAFRYGGEEFLVLVPGGDVEGARQLAERIRVTIGEDQTTGAEGLTISAGVAAADRFSSADPLPLLRLADTALYQAKRNGRDRVVVSGEAALVREVRAAAS